MQTQATETATETQKKLEHLSVTAQKSNNELFETQAKWAKLQEHSEKESASSMQKSQADSQAFQANIAKLEEQLDLQARLQVSPHTASLTLLLSHTVPSLHCCYRAAISL